MKYIIKLLLILVAPYVSADITIEQKAADCLKVKNSSVTGGNYYKLKDYSKAREQYEQQAAWSENCQLSEQEIATAYNNVALTYIHEGKYLKAKAWLDVQSKNNKSIFNHNKVKDEIEISIKNYSNTPEGRYWLYAGKSLWNEFTINKKNESYEFNFEGYHAGLMTMYYGPNIGSFSALLNINNSEAHFDMTEEGDADFDCEYKFTITGINLTVKRVSGTSCGFGHNVAAEGVYQKVEY
ncbi:tetratricopeptide repeat protein [bacterium]|nr:tetratricopeptide repeat protein [bacterium]